MKGRRSVDSDEKEEEFGKLMEVPELPAFAGILKEKKKAARGRKKRAAGTDTEERDLAMLELADQVANSIFASGQSLCVKEVLWDASLCTNLDLTIVEFQAVAVCATRLIAKLKCEAV